MDGYTEEEKGRVLNCMGSGNDTACEIGKCAGINSSRTLEILYKLKEEGKARDVGCLSSKETAHRMGHDLI